MLRILFVNACEYSLPGPQCVTWPVLSTLLLLYQTASQPSSDPGLLTDFLQDPKSECCG